jgi:hypothetical protein
MSAECRRISSQSLRPQASFPVGDVTMLSQLLTLPCTFPSSRCTECSVSSSTWVKRRSTQDPKPKLTPLSVLLLQMLTQTQLAKKLPIFYGILGVNTLFTKSLPILSQINPVYKFLSDFFKISFSIIQLSCSKLCLSLQVFRLKFSYIFTPPLRALCLHCTLTRHIH